MLYALCFFFQLRIAAPSFFAPKVLRWEYAFRIMSAIVSICSYFDLFHHIVRYLCSFVKSNYMFAVRSFAVCCSLFHLSDYRFGIGTNIDTTGHESYVIVTFRQTTYAVRHEKPKLHPNRITTGGQQAPATPTVSVHGWVTMMGMNWNGCWLAFSSLYYSWNSWCFDAIQCWEGNVVEHMLLNSCFLHPSPVFIADTCQ